MNRSIIKATKGFSVKLRVTVRSKLEELVHKKIDELGLRVTLPDYLTLLVETEYEQINKPKIQPTPTAVASDKAKAKAAPKTSKPKISNDDPMKHPKYGKDLSKLERDTIMLLDESVNYSPSQLAKKDPSRTREKISSAWVSARDKLGVKSVKEAREIVKAL